MNQILRTVGKLTLYLVLFLPICDAVNHFRSTYFQAIGVIVEAAIFAKIGSRAFPKEYRSYGENRGTYRYQRESY